MTTLRKTIGPNLLLSAINTDLLTTTVSGWYDAEKFNSASVSIMTTTGISAGAIAFEGTDDVTNAAAGTAVYAYDTGSITAPPVTSLTLAASTTKRFELKLSMRYIRFRISTAVVGGTVGLTATFNETGYTSIRSGALAQLPAALGATTSALSLSVASASDSTWALPASVTVGPNTGISAINTDLLTNTVSGWYDAANVHSLSFTIYTTTGISAGAIAFEQTNDTTNASAGATNGAGINVFESNAGASNPTSSMTLAASTVRTFETPITARYIRLRISTGVTGGTVGATAVFSQLPYATTRLNVQQATGANLVTAAIGNVAEDSASTSAPVMQGGIVRSAIAPSTLAAGDAARLTMSKSASLITRDHSIPELAWAYPAATGGITSATAVTVAAAAGASIRNYMSSIQIAADALGAATEIVVRDGSGGTVLFRDSVSTAGGKIGYRFDPPLMGSANTLMEVAVLTNPITGGVRVNAQGYQQY